MCEVCGHLPHLAQCPYAPEPKVVWWCDACRDGIREGERLILVDGVPICEECVKGMTAEELLDVLDEKYITAEAV